MKKITAIIKIIIRYMTFIIPRRKSVVIFGSWFGQKFSDNAKYLYLACQNDNNLRAIWISKNDGVIKYLNDKGYEAYRWNSLKALYYQLIAKTYFTTTGKEDVQYYLMGSAKHIELWHGIPLKKIMYDNNFFDEGNKIVKNIKRIINRIFNNKYYVLSSSNQIGSIYKSAFRVVDKNILQFGQPRNDVFYEENLEDYEFPQYFKEKKIILYMPTHRNEGKTKIDVSKLFDLDLIDNICKDNNCIFVVKKHYYHKKENDNIHEYNNIVELTNEDIDSQMLLKYTDILITDYSSCFIDYLLLDKPIIFYNYDMNDYILNDRELYFNYEEITPGVKITNSDDVVIELKKILQGQDNYIEQRAKVKKVFYSNSVQRIVSNKIIDFIKA